MKVQRQFFFDYKMKQPLYDMKSFISFTLAKELEKSGDHTTTDIPEEDNNDLDVSIPNLDLKLLDVIRALKLKPGCSDFSKLSTSDSDPPRDSGKTQAVEQTNLAIEDLKHNEFYGLGDMDQFGCAKIGKILIPDIVPKRCGRMSGLLGKICGTRVPYEESLLGCANRMRIKIFPEIYSKGRMSPRGLFDVDKIMKATDFSGQSWDTRMPFNLQMWCKFQESNNDSGASGDGENDSTIKTDEELNLDTYNTAPTLDTDPISRYNLSIEAKRSQLSKLIEVAIIVETGEQLFCKPTKLYTFDCEDVWKKIGEGHIEIWSQPDSSKCCMMLWDKDSGDLLLYMPIDGKWNISYIIGSINSCRWLYYNYANCTQGIQQSLSCHFENSDLAAELMRIFANCMQNTDSP